tara:strand:+ start:2764 stop:3201 length:438 start_codon:yes stop_codon:yes gene_type:complete
MLNSFFMISLLFSGVSHAEEGKFTLMPKNRPAPYKGVLFDEVATSKLLALPEKYKLQCDLDIEYKIDRLNTDHNLEKKNLMLDLENLRKEHKVMLETKDKQVENLNKELKKRIGINKEWYLFGGIAIGVGITTGMFAIWNRTSGD